MVNTNAMVNTISHWNWITLNGGPTGRVGWMAVLPNEKHEFSAGWRVQRWSMVNGLWFHMTQPTSTSIIKAITCR